MADHTQIVSSTARRTRIRLSRKRRHPKEMARIAEVLEASPQVSSVQANLNTGTIIVHHKQEGLEDIKSRLQDMGVILMAAAGVETSAMSLADAVSDLDRHLGLGTRGLLNLKLLVPLGFGALAVLQLARQGFQIAGAPWYLLAYFAFDSYTRLNSTEEKCAPEGSTAGQ
jgi:copper chaperone CopZ